MVESLNKNIILDGKPNPYLRLILRLSHIAVLGNVYLLGGIITAIIIDSILPKFDQEKYDKKNVIIVYLEVFFYASLIMATAYFLRKLIKTGIFRFIPQGFYGYDNTRVREAHGGVILAFSVITFHSEFRKKIEYLINNRVLKKK